MSNEHLSSPHFRSSHPFNPVLAAPGANPFVGHWREALSEIKGRSPALERVLRLVVKVARTDSPVLVYGESGTGKELIARALHRLSSRSNRRFIAINCSAIPENLLESELFGYVKGAFTGADSRRKGYFEEASGGTIFLDEIGDMPMRLQSKLLRVLQEKQFTPIGAGEARRADVRIVAATNVNLEEAVRKQDFRLDLFYRLNVLPIHMPSLRERREDIRFLLEHFLAVANEQHGLVQPCYLTPDVITVLEQHSWPGNVRELQNLIERLVVISGGGAIRLEELPSEYQQTSTSAGPAREPAAASQPGYNPTPTPAPEAAANVDHQLVSESYRQVLVDGLLPEGGVNLARFIEDLENRLILQALERTGQNKNRAAKLLGLNRTTLVERIKKRQLAPLNSPSKEL
jgi:transcriptional regulator with PAS, ATPase and Fis domain